MNTYLIIGSAPYIMKWWSRYGEIFIKNGYKIIPINNAVKVVPKDSVFKWMRANDYLHFMKEHHNDVSLANDEDYDIVVTQPQLEHLNPKSKVMTTFIDALHMILTDNENKPIEVCVTGCDYNYNDDKTHFYKTKGTLDPLRFGRDKLVIELEHCMKRYENNNSKLINVGYQKETLLPFPKYK